MSDTTSDPLFPPGVIKLEEIEVRQPDIETWSLNEDGVHAQISFDANNSELVMLKVSTEFFRTLLQRAGFEQVDHVGS